MVMELQEITMVIPTHNRKNYLRRILEYYSQTSLRIIIADSSNEPYPFAIDNTNVEYYYCPETGLSKKLFDVLSQVETKFVVMCADDDFTLPDAIKQCVEFLKENENFAVAQGNVLAYSKEKTIVGDVSFSILYKNMLSFSIEANDPMKRIEQLFRNYRSIFYAVHYTDNLKSAFEGASKAVQNLYLNEYVTVLPIVNGNYVELPILFQVREHSQDSGDKTTINLDEMLGNQAYASQIESFIDFMRRKISFFTKESSDFVRKALFDILKDFAGRISESKRPSFKKKIGNRIAELPLIGKKIIQLNRKLAALRKDNLSLVVRTSRERQELDYVSSIILKYKDSV